MIAHPGISLVDGDIGGDIGRIGRLRIAGTRIESIDGEPARYDRVVDLRGDRVLPGLINAHDHLQLNNFGRLKCREQHANVREWIEDVSMLKQTSRSIKATAATPLDPRLLLGGVKNLLSGVTTVAHHDPLYASLTMDTFPIRVVRDYGWSHSLLIDGDERVRTSYRHTPSEWPWIIHAAEGLDDAAHAEFERLEALNCIGANTLIVHGVALDASQMNRLGAAGAGLIWCPTSNLHLFGVTADASALIRRGQVALGSDSRLSGGRDLLDELAVAREVGGFDEPTLEHLVTAGSARLLRLHDRGVLRTNAAADLIVLPPQLPLSRATRADIRLVMVEGRMLYADLHYAAALAPASQWLEVLVDGRPKALDRTLALRLAESDVREPGLDIPTASWRAA